MTPDDDRPSLDDPDFAAKLAARARARARVEDPALVDPDHLVAAERGAVVDAVTTGPSSLIPDPEPVATTTVDDDPDIRRSSQVPEQSDSSSIYDDPDDHPSSQVPDHGDSPSIYDDPDFRPTSQVPDDDAAIEEFFADDDDEPPGLDRRLRTAIEWAAVIVGALAVALLIKTFLFQAFYIPSESMTPTLMKNDRILVYKLDKDPQRGDLMVFERPPNAATNDVNELIKRTLALEGETISIRDNVLYIDDQRLLEPYIGPDVVSSGRVWTSGCVNPQGDGSSCEVPDDHVFMMGDNRTNSVDSRSFGPVDLDLMVGRAVLRVWPLGEFGRL
ncbi:MAG: signal peptidase I [Acidimicrobiales bacterium]